jgi:hypothetical protein
MRWTDEDDEFLAQHTGYLWGKIQERAAEGVWIRHPVRRTSRLALLIGWLWRRGDDILAAVVFVALMVVLGILLGLIAWGKP